MSEDAQKKLSLEHMDGAQELISYYEFMVCERHLDVFGHVNNAQYMSLFEEARWDRITRRGYGLKEILESKIGTVILESTIRYRRELKNREKVTIETSVLGFNKKIITLKQKMLKEDGEIAADAEFKAGCFDLVQRKLIVPSDAWIFAILGIKT